MESLEARVASEDLASMEGSMVIKVVKVKVNLIVNLEEVGGEVVMVVEGVVTVQARVLAVTVLVI